MLGANDGLTKLFAELDEWRKRGSLTDDYPCDQLAIICLKILGRVLDDGELLRSIGKYLSLIFEVDGTSAEEELVDSFSLIEDDLEESLRGFSSLLSFVLEENTISRNPAVVLGKVNDVDETIIDRFNELSQAIDAYLDLNDAFGMHAPRVFVVIFLRTLEKIYDGLLGPRCTLGRLAVTQWLHEHVKDDKIFELYISFSESIDFSKDFTKEANRDALILMLCIKVANGESLRSDETEIYEKALKASGLLGLKPLLEAGFLRLADQEPYEIKNDAKILRVI